MEGAIPLLIKWGKEEYTVDLAPEDTVGSLKRELAAYTQASAVCCTRRWLQLRMAVDATRISTTAPAACRCPASAKSCLG